MYRDRQRDHASTAARRDHHTPYVGCKKPVPSARSSSDVVRFPVVCGLWSPSHRSDRLQCAGDAVQHAEDSDGRLMVVGGVLP